MALWRTLAALVVATGLAACSSGSTAKSSLDVHRLPLGDGKYLTKAKRGYIFSCMTQFGGGGAMTNGPWIDEDSGTWDLTDKIAVQGSVRWDSSFSRKLGHSRLKLSGNGLPPHTTGVYPVQSADPAYQYDRNPNSIKPYTPRVSLPRNP